MIGVRGLLVAMLVTGLPSAVWAEGPLDRFFPLVSRRPVIESEIELRTVHERRRDRRETMASLAVEVPIVPRWALSLSMPLAFSEPREGASTGGAGDLELESKAMIWASPDQRALLTVGLALTLPTGSERRGLGGRTALEPFAAAGFAAGDVLIVSDVGYVVPLDGRKGDDGRLRASVAVAHPLGPRVLPLLALTGARSFTGGDGRVELYVSPGVNVRLHPRATLGLGLQLPLTGARGFDQAWFASIDWDL